MEPLHQLQSKDLKEVAHHRKKLQVLNNEIAKMYSYEVGLCLSFLGVLILIADEVLGIKEVEDIYHVSGSQTRLRLQEETAAEQGAGA